MNTRGEVADRFAWMFKASRESAGKSQEYMAKALGKTKTTIQNWENGTSSPRQTEAFEWFQALGVQPLPYYLRVLYPEEFEHLNAKSNDTEVDKALIRYLRDWPIELKRKLLYLFEGEHGSSPMAIVEMLMAHLQTPLRSRLNIASNIYHNYVMAQTLGEVIGPDHIQPNIEVLHKAWVSGIEAVGKGLKAYSLMK